MIKYQYINWKSNLNWQVPAVFVIYIKWWSDDKISCGQFVRRTLSCFHWQCHLQKVGINLHNNDSLWVNTSDAWFSFGFQTLCLLSDIEVLQCKCTLQYRSIKCSLIEKQTEEKNSNSKVQKILQTPIHTGI